MVVEAEFSALIRAHGGRASNLPAVRSNGERFVVDIFASEIRYEERAAMFGFFTDVERISFHWPLPGYFALLVVAEQDFGKALGMLLRPQLQQLPLAVIDEVSVRAGDYIDIGTPLFGGSVVPVTVKSLAFPS